jgi:putative MATE family efflux protein
VSSPARGLGVGPDAAATLGTAPVGRLLWRSCSQTTLSVGVYGVYALTNAWFVAHGVGDMAMAAVNVAAPVLMLLGAVATTVGAGGASLVSRSLGAGDTAGAARAAGAACTVFWTAALAITVTGMAALGPLLTLLGAHGALRGLARDYATVLLAGAVVSTGFSSLVRAEGRMRYSTMLWVIPVLVQITLDPVLIFGLHLGVRGAAAGTVGGQAVSAAMSVWFFFLQKHRPYRITAADLRPHWPTLRALIGVGAPSFLTGLGATALAVLVNATLARTGNVTALAAYAICARIQTFTSMPQTGISQGLQPVAAYNHGRSRPDRVRRARTLALRATAGYGILAAAAAALAAGPVVAVFAADPAVASVAARALRVIAIAVAVAGITPLASSYFQSLGRPGPSYLLSAGTLLLLKIPLVAVLGHTRPAGMWAALAIGELASAAAALIMLSLRDRPELESAPAPGPAPT